MSMILHFKRCHVAAAVEEGIWKCEAGQKATPKAEGHPQWKWTWKLESLLEGEAVGNEPRSLEDADSPERLVCPGGGHFTFGGQAGRTDVGVGKL